MKLSEVKHNHSLTDLLKILIFSILMLAPILSVATRCLYVVCNKNAYQSYSSTKQINVVEVTSTSNLIDGETYILSISKDDNITQSLTIGFYDSTFDYSAITNRTDLNKFTYNGAYLNGYVDNTQIFSINKSNSETDFFFKTNYFVMDLSLTNPNNTNLVYLKWENIIFNKLDNVFEYSVSTLESNELFNWTQNTGVYTGVNAMCTGLGLQGSVIQILITYWFLLTVIYIIIDIVLKLFTVLTHTIGNKKG